MKHRVFGRKLGRNKDERRRLFTKLVRAIFEKGRIRTTLAKAKAVQPMVEKHVTRAKASKTAGGRFAARSSGYTRIVKLGKRSGDAAEMVFLEFVDPEPAKIEVIKPKVVSPKKPKSPKLPK